MAAAAAAVANEGPDELELYFKNIPFTATAEALVAFLESKCGRKAVTRCEIKTNNKGTSSGWGFVRFASVSLVVLVRHLAQDGQLCFAGRRLSVSSSNRIKRRPQHSNDFLEGCKLFLGNLSHFDGASATCDYLWASETPVTVEFFFSGDVRLEPRFEQGDREYKLQVNFQSIVALDSGKIRECESCLILQLLWCPKVFMRELERYDEVENTSETNSRYVFLRDLARMFKEVEWIRSSDFSRQKAIGQSVVMVLVFPPSLSSAQFNKILERFYDYSLGKFPPEHKRVNLMRGRPFASDQEVGPILPPNPSYRLPLDLEFQVNYLIQHGYVSPACITQEFFGLLAANSVERSLSALARLSKRETTCLNPVSKVQSYFDRNSGSSRRRPNRDPERYFGTILPDEGQVYVKRAMVTPSKVYFLGPEIEVSNRVTREFKSKIDNFLRLTFVDEDFDKLNSFVLQRAGGGIMPERTGVYERIKTVLRNGLKFGGKNFQFLAFSSSQLRENSVWMFADDERTTADGIRRWMGDFMSIKNIAKCAARMGQSFSSSTQTLRVRPDELEYARDVESYSVMGKTYCFSDGIGKISREFGIQVASKCSAKSVPSAFQIRYGGYKGVVAVDPRSTSKLSVRPSMSKFKSTQTGLDVLSWSKYIPCYLNREIITLLSTLDVPDHVFERMQDQVVQKLDGLLRDSATALEVLQSLHAGESHGLMVAMLSAGCSPSLEPYLASLLQAFRASQLMLLQTKSKILVPKGRCLMGCLDEYRILDYKQCFVQVSLAGRPQGSFQVHHDRGVTGSNSAFVVQGRVVVAKNPCLHPGDVLVLEAVDVPELHHMVDCIVFPQKGVRPHPNECSGGDLDGDLYFVTWDTSLFPKKSFPSMEYDAAPAQTLPRPIILDDIITFFTNFMSSANLGQIANSYLALADSSKLKAMDPDCLELARLFSIAVDFPKTGVPAVVPAQLRPKSYPDFMEKNDKPSHKSERVIGKLYRSVKSHSFESLRPRTPEEEYDRELLMRGYEQHVDEARFLKARYDEKLMGLLNRYDLSEAEIMGGSIRNLSRLYRRRQSDAKDRIQLAAKALVKEARGWFDDGEETGAEVFPKASAWYHVTYKPSLRRQEEQLLSFPWVVHDLLLQIKRNHWGN